MNRVRFNNNRYQVLITPDYINSTSFEVLLDNWLDSSFNNYYILDFDNMQDALYEALKYPDIDWYKLVSCHVDNYKMLKDRLEKKLTRFNFTVEFKPNLITPEELKNSMFDRVLLQGKQFNMTYGINDIITFNILNIWTKNLEFIADVLQKEESLKIFAKHHKNNAIYLSGKTDIGTSYSIIMIPTHLYNVLKWLMRNKNNTNAESIFQQAFAKAVEQQAEIDKDTSVL